jgi:hypothetical protein
MSLVAPDARPWIGRLVRLGYLAKGLIYVFIGVLAARVALGVGGGRLTDASGILMTLLYQPFGTLMLALIGIGIVGYALYYIFEALADLRGRGGGVKGWIDRSLTVIKAIAYGTIGLEALNIVLRDRRPGGGAEQNARLVMRFPLGEVLLVLVGLGIAVYGLTQLHLVWRGKVDDDIDEGRVRREAPWLLRFGQFGIAARSIILLLMGGTLLWSGLRERPSDADGYSDALRTIASFNPWLLAAIATGLFCFGVYQLCHARYARIVE